MKTHKSLVVLATAALAGAAFAQYTSPEMLMVTDSGGTLANGTVVPAQVERYDPYTGNYLGAFGAGYLAGGIPDGITIVGQNAYVTDLFSVRDGTSTRASTSSTSAQEPTQGSVFNGAPYQLTSDELLRGQFDSRVTTATAAATGIRPGCHMDLVADRARRLGATDIAERTCVTRGCDRGRQPALGRDPE